MILVCPQCKASYLVPAQVFAAGPRTVRCARCAHSWLADLPSNMAVLPQEETKPPEPVPVTTPEPEPQPEPKDPVASAQPPVESPPDQPPSESQAPENKEIVPEADASVPVTNLPALRPNPWHKKALMLVLVVLGMLIVGAASWLFIDNSLLKELGVVSGSLGEGLSLENIRSERRYENGGMQLVVEGDIRNKSDKAHKVPDIMVNAIGFNKQPIQSWRIPAPTATLAAGATASFQSSIVPPEGTVVEVHLSFVEPRHDDKP